MTEKKYIRSILTILLFQWMGNGAMAQGKYDLFYTVGLDTAAHYLNVELTYTQKGGTNTDELVLNMPVWTPGYYEILNFPKHLCDFAAKDAKGNRLTWRKEGMNRWRVQTSDCQEATISYRIYANRRDVASSRVDGSAAFIAPAGVFMHVDGEINHPSTIPCRFLSKCLLRGNIFPRGCYLKPRMAIRSLPKTLIHSTTHLSSWETTT